MTQEKDWKLEDKIIESDIGHQLVGFAVSDVKEFIKRLKEELRINTKLPYQISDEIINRLTGQSLVGDGE